MSPEERGRVLSTLPPERRARIVQGLIRIDKLSPPQRKQLEHFLSLPPEQQQQVRELALKMKSIPNDRKNMVRKEIFNLQNMPPEQRERRLNSPGFQKKFTPEEQDILRLYPTLLPENYF